MPIKSAERPSTTTRSSCCVSPGAGCWPQTSERGAAKPQSWKRRRSATREETKEDMEKQSQTNNGINHRLAATGHQRMEEDEAAPPDASGARAGNQTSLRGGGWGTSATGTGGNPGLAVPWVATQRANPRGSRASGAPSSIFFIVASAGIETGIGLWAMAAVHCDSASARPSSAAAALAARRW